MGRLVRAVQRLAGLLLVCAVVFGAARESLLGDRALLPVFFALGLAVYLGFRAWRAVRKLLPRGTARMVSPPQLPGRAHWLSPRRLQRRGRP